MWKITSYYTPLPNQNDYYTTYGEDLYINCSGDCSITASGAKVDNLTVACPPEFAFGTRIFIDGVGEKICRDRGGAIKNKRLDVWTGYGDAGLEIIKDPTRTPSGTREVWLLE